VALIKSIPQQYFGDIEKRITAGVRSGTRWEDLAQELQDRYDVSESRAALIARDQVGKFYGELNEVRQTALGVKSFIWRTANDERVREEHADLEGETFDWDTPPSEGIPGEAVNCRCFAEPVLDDLLSES
jgi:SPP1 gp7 family putative phage head morphogenesis protein